MQVAFFRTQGTPIEKNFHKTSLIGKKFNIFGQKSLFSP